MKKIRTAHFGIAHDHSAVTLECARKYPDIFEIVGICEPDDATRHAMSNHPAYAGIPWLTEDELLSRNDIDAVLCEGHELRSVSDAQKCIDRGFHVHLDKPGGIDIVAFEALLKSAHQKELTLQMGYMYRYNPAFRYIVKAVHEGVLGTITGIDGTFSILHTPEKRKWLGQFPGGMMFFIGCHVIDMILLLNGLPVDVHPFNRSSDHDNNGSLDSAFAVLDYPRGVCTVRTNATEINGYARRMLLVSGTKASIEIRPLECPTLMNITTLDDVRNRVDLADASRCIFPGYMAGRYDDMMMEFAACVRGEIKNPYSWEYELALQKVVLKASGLRRIS